MIIPTLYQYIKESVSFDKLTDAYDLPGLKQLADIGNVYAVGGIVRDQFVDKKSKDLDVVVTGVPLETVLSTLKIYGKVDEVGVSFGVIKFNPTGISLDEPIDVALPRTDRQEGDGHRGIVAKPDPNLPIEKDLERRDFTINALAVNIKTGEIIDPFGGRADLRRKIIKAVSLSAFAEDPLRILRAIQFAVRFDFDIEPKTAQLIGKHLHRLSEISQERFLIELEKMRTKGVHQKAFRLLNGIGFLGIRNRPLVKTKTPEDFYWIVTGGDAEVYKNNIRGENDVYRRMRVIQAVSENPKDGEYIFATLTKPVDREQLLDSEILSSIIDLRPFRLGKKPIGFGELALNGGDIMKTGRKGPEIGKAQELLMRAVLSGTPNTKSELQKVLYK